LSSAEIPFSESPIQRYLYSHDVSNAPLIGLFLKMPDAVYQPRNEQEVLEILKIAKERKTPVIPRGAGTSGYGGVLPTKGGIIIDFTRMDAFEVDEDKMLIECEPGAVWWDIEKKLNKKGLSLRVYPSSALSSTVAGWIAQDGYGYGSLKYGGIRDNVVKLRIVDFNGVREVEGEELKKYVGMEGTTGLIVRAWIKVKKQEDMRYYAFFVSPNEAEKLVYSGDHYTAFFLDSGYIKLKNMAFGTNMPEKDTLMIATTQRLEGDESIGEEIWNGRFYPLRIKKLGPSLVEAENILPSNKIEEYITLLKNKIKSPNGSEVCYIKDRRGAVLTFILSDERKKIAYPLTWRYSLKAVKIAKRMGGVSYSTGLFLSHESKTLLGKDYSEILAFKKKVDPNSLLNPGKVFPEGIIPFFIRLAGLIA